MQYWLEEYRKIYRCKIVKEMKDKLKLTHQGTKQVKHTIANVLSCVWAIYEGKWDVRWSVWKAVSQQSWYSWKIIKWWGVGEKTFKNLTKPCLSKIFAIQEGGHISTLTFNEWLARRNTSKFNRITTIV